MEDIIDGSSRQNGPEATGSSPQARTELHAPDAAASDAVAADAAAGSSEAGLPGSVDGGGGLQQATVADPIAPSASPFANTAPAAPDVPAPASDMDNPVPRRRPLMAASKTVTTGLQSAGSPATDTTIRAGGSQAGMTVAGASSGFAACEALPSSAALGGPTGPGAVTPATSLSTGLGSNPSVKSDQTLPPAPSGQLSPISWWHFVLRAALLVACPSYSSRN